MTSMFQTRLSVMQAPIGGSVSPELVAAVGIAGGLGTLPCRTPEQLVADIEALRYAAGDVPFAVNLLGKADVDDQVVVILDLAVPVAHWSWGVQADRVERLRRSGVYCTAQVASVGDAMAAEAAGIQALIVQGCEAGGGIQGETARDVLLGQVRRATSVPVGAAGGISSAAQAAAVRSLGADGVMAGTSFIATPESRSHPVWVEAVLAASGDDTVISLLFSEGDPAYRQRTLCNRVVQEWLSAGSPEPGSRPGEGEVVAKYDQTEIPRYADAPPLKGMTGSLDLLQMPAGKGVGAIKEVLPAADVIGNLSGT